MRNEPTSAPTDAHDVVAGGFSPSARIVMITAMTASENASRRSVVRSNGTSALSGSVIAAMIGLAPRSARWQDGRRERGRPQRREGAAKAPGRLADVPVRPRRGAVGAAIVRPCRGCFQRLPDVFDPWSRPWVRPEAADPDTLADVVMRCPSGALHFRRLDDGPQETELVGDEVELVALADGPMQVRGHVKLIGGDGETIREDTRMVLCRCGSSRTKPLCDGTHRIVGFTDPPR